MALGGRGPRAVSRHMIAGAAHRTGAAVAVDIAVDPGAGREAGRRRDSGMVRHMDSGPVPRTGPGRHKAVAAEADRTLGEEGVAGRRRTDPVGVARRREAVGVVRRGAGSSHLAEEEVLLHHL